VRFAANQQNAHYKGGVPNDFLSAAERNQMQVPGDPLDWVEDNDSPFKPADGDGKKPSDFD